MKFKFFDFKKDNERHDVDYLEMIEDENIRKLVSNFFEPSVLECVSPKMARALVEAINEDVRNGIFTLKKHNRTYETVTNSFNLMNEEQLNSKTHQLFLKVINDGFGRSAVKTLKQRKNLNIFNMNEVHVLHQEVFDAFGEGFVNRILNNDLTPQSLIIIKNILSDKNEMDNFKYYYDFYTKNVGEKQADFERMVRSFEQYKGLIGEIRQNKHKLTPRQKETLTDILNDKDNRYNVSTISDIDHFYETRNQRYFIEKEVAKEKCKDGSMYSMSEGIDALAKALFRNYYGVEAEKKRSKFTIMDRNPHSICRYFDIEEASKGDLSAIFTKDELDMLQDMKTIDEATRSLDKQGAFNTLLQMCEKYEKKGNEVSLTAARMFDKLPKTFEREMVDSLSRVDLIKERAEGKEKGIYVQKDPRTDEGKEIELPVYVFDGADFSFLSTTNYTTGLSGNSITGDLAASWFEYENGTMHICCSYANQDNLSNLEFNRMFDPENQVSYFFDDAEILTMGSGDIFTPETPRVSNVFSEGVTKFMTTSKMASKTTVGSYNEVDINRYDYSGESVDYAGKIIPSGILCCDEVSQAQLNAARSFTKYCVENGLKPEGWQMPLVVVKKERYIEIQKMKKKGLITKNSEYFMSQEEKNKQEENDKNVLKTKNDITLKTVSNGR